MDDNPGSAQTPPPAAAQPASPPTPEQAAEESPSPKRKWFPSALTVLVIVLLDELERSVVAEAESSASSRRKTGVRRERPTLELRECPFTPRRSLSRHARARRFLREPSSISRVCAVVIVMLLALAAAGCGKSESQKQADQYADSLCTSISVWEQEVTSIAANLTPGVPKQVAQAKLEQAKAVTASLVSEIRALPVPDVDGASEAKQNVDQFVTSAQSVISTIEAGITQIKSFGTGAANVATVVVPIAAQLTKLVADAKATVSSLEAVKGPFEEAVKDSDTCQALMPDQNQ